VPQPTTLPRAPKVNYGRILKWILKNAEYVGVDWIHLAQDRDQWRSLVNKAMNFRVVSRAGNFVTEGVAGAQEGFSSIELVR
jgi:hypothetical protein